MRKNEFFHIHFRSSYIFANSTAFAAVHVPTGRVLTGLIDPQLRHACIQEGLILGMGSVALNGDNSQSAIDKYGKVVV